MEAKTWSLRSGRDPVENEKQVIDALVECAPSIIERYSQRRSRCVMATAIGLEVLDYFGIPAKEMPCEVDVFNEIAWKWYQAGCLENAPADAGILSVRMDRPVEANRKEWNGHLVILTKNDSVVIIDLDMQQFNRPEKNILVPSAASFDWAKDKLIGGWHATDAYHSTTIVYKLKPGVKSYKQGDWTMARLRRKAKFITAPIIRSVREQLKTG